MLSTMQIYLELLKSGLFNEKMNYYQKHTVITYTEVIKQVESDLYEKAKDLYVKQYESK